MADTTFVGRSTPLTRAGVEAAAQATGTGPLELWTVVSVETSGCGFLRDRRPPILFERHYFHRLTGGKFDQTHPDISAPAPGGYGSGGANQYTRLAEALALNREAALRSASWGIGQIMGDNFAATGFADVESMVAAMVDSEDAQLAAMASFCRNSKMATALQNHDWKTFASRYNGPNYAINQYDTKLSAAFAAGKLPDFTVRAAQLYLTFRGLNTGGVDGQTGSKTRAAVVAFQKSQGLPETGVIDDALIASLSASLS